MGVHDKKRGICLWLNDSDRCKRFSWLALIKIDLLDVKMPGENCRLGVTGEKSGYDELYTHCLFIRVLQVKKPTQRKMMLDLKMRL